MTPEELKVAAWDIVTQIEQLNQRLTQIRTELFRREQADKVITVDEEDKK